MDTKAIIKANRTYVPIRYVAEGLGATVKWDDGNDTVIIKRKGQEQQQKYKKVNDLNYPIKLISDYGKTFDHVVHPMYPMDKVMIIKKSDLPVQISKSIVIHDIKLSADKKNILLIQENITGSSYRDGLDLAVKNEGLRNRNSVDYYEKDLGNNMYETTHYIVREIEEDYKTFSIDKVEYIVFGAVKDNLLIAIQKEDALNE
jgi:hypothetical protein